MQSVRTHTFVCVCATASVCVQPSLCAGQSVCFVSASCGVHRAVVIACAHAGVAGGVARWRGGVQLGGTDALWAHPRPALRISAKGRGGKQVISDSLA